MKGIIRNKTINQITPEACYHMPHSASWSKGIKGRGLNYSEKSSKKSKTYKSFVGASISWEEWLLESAKVDARLSRELLAGYAMLLKWAIIPSRVPNLFIIFWWWLRHLRQFLLLSIFDILTNTLFDLLEKSVAKSSLRLSSIWM